MQVEALLCDAATVRESLLHLLGGGITRIWRPSFPATLALDLALMLTMTRTEAQEKHRLRVIVQTEDGKPLADLSGEFGIAPGTGAALKPGERIVIPVALPLRDVEIPGEGTYGIEVLIDGQLQRSFTFVAAPPQQPG